jgi:hypothetical protein
MADNNKGAVAAFRSYKIDHQACPIATDFYTSPICVEDALLTHKMWAMTFCARSRQGRVTFPYARRRYNAFLLSVASTERSNYTAELASVSLKPGHLGAESQAELDAPDSSTGAH